MAKRFYTCIIVPEASHRLHKLRIPAHVLHVLSVIGAISFLVSVALGFSYMRMAFKVADYDELQAENSELKIETKNLEVSAKKLSSKINELENVSERLTRVIESDTVYRRFAKLNVDSAGGSRQDYSTSELVNGNLRSHVDFMRDRTTELESRFKLLEQVSEKRSVILSHTPYMWPLRGPIGSPFGGRLDPFTGDAETHVGLDIIGLYGAAVRAPADGQVIFANRKSDYGNLIILDHGNGLTTRYGHLSHFNVHSNQWVHKGDIIGSVGISGRTTAPHLHYEVRQNDRPVNPKNYLPKGD